MSAASTSSFRELELNNNSHEKKTSRPNHVLLRYCSVHYSTSQTMTSDNFRRSHRGIQQRAVVETRDAPATNTAPRCSKTRQHHNNTSTQNKNDHIPVQVHSTPKSRDRSDAIPPVDKCMNTYVLIPFGNPVHAGRAEIFPPGIPFYHFIILWTVLVCTGFGKSLPRISAGFLGKGTENHGRTHFHGNIV